MGIDFDGAVDILEDNDWLADLREFGEVPKDYVSVYLVVSREVAKAVAKNGVLAYEPKKMAQITRDKKIDEIFKENGLFPRRKGSFFAYFENPNTPVMASRRMTIEVGDVILEVKVDPKKCYVAEAEKYDDPEAYVESVITYQEFSEFVGYERSGFWEVIVPVEGSVPTSLVKVFEVVKEVKDYD